MSEDRNVLTYKCPNCGAPVQYDGKGEVAVTCNYCGAAAPVPAELLPHPAITTSQLVTKANPTAVSEVTPVAASVTGCGLAALFSGIAVAASLIVAIAVATHGFSSAGSNVVDVGGAKATVSAIKPTKVVVRPTPVPTPTPRYAIPTLAFGGEGVGVGLFKDARSVGVDGDGNIYVGEYTGGRIQVFDSQGDFINSFFAGHSNSLMLGFAVDRTGHVYVADGQYITRYDGKSGKSLGRLVYPGGPGFGELAVTSDGGLVAMWYQRREGIFTSTEGAREDLVRFDAQGKVVLVIQGPISSQTDDVELNNLPAVDGQGNTYILAEMASSIFKFSPEGKFINRFGSRGSGAGQLLQASSLAIDSRGQLYVADFNHVHIFGPTGQAVHTFSLDRSAGAFTFDDKGDLIVLSNDRTHVTRYTLGL